MMNLQLLAGAMIQSVNPDVIGKAMRSTGYATDTDFKRVATYQTFDPVTFQVQALSGDDLKQIDGLNVQGVYRAVYANMRLRGEDRAGGVGGDLLVIPAGANYVPLTGGASDTFLCTQVLEPWDVTGWCKVAVTLQSVSPSGEIVTFVGDNTQPVEFDGSNNDPVTFIGTPQ